MTRYPEIILSDHFTNFHAKQRIWILRSGQRCQRKFSDGIRSIKSPIALVRKTTYLISHSLGLCELVDQRSLCFSMSVVGQIHIVRTTRNSALPLIIRA
jgi:hypothetical protein